MFRSDFVSFNLLSAGIKINCMESQLFPAGDKLVCKSKVCSQFIDGACLSGIVAGGLDTAGEIAVGIFKAGNVIALGMPVNYSSDEFAAGIVEGLTFLAGKEGPYLVHCTEGKDRAGFTSMLLAALMGASVEEIVADYMTSYVNYYGIDPVAEADKYNMIAEKNVMDMLRTVCGLEKNASLEGVDLASGAQKYLTDHGMTAEAVAALKANLQ